MIVYTDTKVYVLCPSGRRSETADNCHWLCAQLIRLGVEAYMVYLPGGGENISVDDFYLRYNLPYDTGVEDSAKNIVIVPEVAATYLYFTKETRRVLWWFDVDNFFRDMGARLVRQFDNILTQPMPKFFTFSHFDEDVEHWAQSEYARQFLKVNGVPDEKVYAVSDCLNKNFLNYAVKIDTAAKKNLVAYRPVPNRDFTDVVKNLANGVEWRAVEDLTAAALQKLFAEAKVYVDFSDHGAKDKLTREAAVSGCVVNLNSMKLLTRRWRRLKKLATRWRISTPSTLSKAISAKKFCAKVKAQSRKLLRRWALPCPKKLPSGLFTGLTTWARTLRIFFSRMTASFSPRS